MERRLIDAEAFWKSLELSPDEWAKGRTIEAHLNQAPTIDAVEVVRCRECAYMHVPRCCPCQISGFKVDDDWYCPMGVRREPDGK